MLDGIRNLSPEEKKEYEDYKQKEEEFDYNNQTVLRYLSGYELNDEEKEKMNKYLQSLITEEEALDLMKKENEYRIKDKRKSMKLLYLEKRFKEMPERLRTISDPFELERYNYGHRVLKGINDNTEFIDIDRTTEKKLPYDFEVTSEYIIIGDKSYYIDGSVYTYDYEKNAFKSHNAHMLIIYIPPRENEYPEGTRISDLIRKKKEEKYREELKQLYDRIKGDKIDPELFRDIFEKDERETK